MSRTKWLVAWSTAVPLLDHVVAGDTKCTVTKQPDRTLPNMTAWTDSKYTSSNIRALVRLPQRCLEPAPETQLRAERRLPPTESGVRAQTASLQKISSTVTSWHPEHQLQLDQEIMSTAASSAANICMHRNLLGYPHPMQRCTSPELKKNIKDNKKKNTRRAHDAPLGQVGCSKL